MSTTYQVGDVVDVLSAMALPHRLVVVHTGRIHKITNHGTDGFMRGAAIYWVEGRKCGVGADVLRIHESQLLEKALKAEKTK